MRRTFFCLHLTPKTWLDKLGFGPMSTTLSSTYWFASWVITATMNKNKHKRKIFKKSLKSRAWLKKYLDKKTEIWINKNIWELVSLWNLVIMQTDEHFFAGGINNGCPLRKLWSFAAQSIPDYFQHCTLLRLFLFTSVQRL